VRACACACACACVCVCVCLLLQRPNAPRAPVLHAVLAPAVQGGAALAAHDGGARGLGLLSVGGKPVDVHGAVPSWGALAPGAGELG